MAKKQGKDKLGAQITFRTTDESYLLVEQVMSREKRRQNETIRALLDIGLYTSRREGKSLVEWLEMLEEWKRGLAEAQGHSAARVYLPAPTSLQATDIEESHAPEISEAGGDYADYDDVET